MLRVSWDFGCPDTVSLVILLILHPEWNLPVVVSVVLVFIMNVDQHVLSSMALDIWAHATISFQEQINGLVPFILMLIYLLVTLLILLID